MGSVSPVAHVASAALFAADLALRSARVHALVRVAGARLSAQDALTLTAFGDAAAVVTPWRAGGEVARVLSARLSGVPVPVSVVVMAIESAIGYLLAALVGAWLMAAYGGDWLASLDGVRVELPLAWIRAMAVLAYVVLSVVIAVPAARARVLDAIRGVAAAVRSLRALPPGAIAWCVVLSAASLASRVLVLPILAMGSASAGFGVLTLVSFALLHAQVALPTPGGAGPIELVFLKGGAGVSHGIALLGWWRVYVTVLPLAVGFSLAAIVHGRQAWRVLPWRSPTSG